MPAGVSLYLDLVRFGAAFVVFLDHSAEPFIAGGSPWLHRQAFGVDAVMVFFVLSGFVIAYAAEHKERDLGSFAAARLARLWSVALPALVLTFFADAFGLGISPAPYAGNGWFSTTQWPLDLLASATFTNEVWFWSRHPLSDGPFWSLGFEAWYYAIFAAASFLPRARLSAVVLLMVAVGPRVLTLFPIWLMGVEVYRVRAPSRGIGWALFLGPPVAYAALRWVDLDHHVLLVTKWFPDEHVVWFTIIGFLVSLHFLGLRAVHATAASWLAPAERFIRACAGCTLSLYLFHVPLQEFGAAVAASLGLGGSAIRVTIAALSFLAAMLLGRVFEPQKARMREWIFVVATRLARIGRATSA